VVQVEQLSKQAAQEKIPFIDALLQSTLINARALAAFSAETFGYPLLDLDTINPALLPEKVIDARLMQSQRVLVLGKRGNKVFVALSDPTNLHALDQIKFQTELTVEAIIVDHASLLKLIEKRSHNTQQ